MLYFMRNYYKERKAIPLSKFKLMFRKPFKLLLGQKSLQWNGQMLRLLPQLQTCAF